MSSHGAFQKLIATPEPPRLGPQRRAGTLGADELNRALDLFFTHERISAHAQPLLRSAALLWHDHLDASHTISQGVETRDGSWLHGIMHRREPDYGNAKYWFHRVGWHDAFPELARRVAVLLDENSDGLTGRLIENGEWLPFAFVDECEGAEQGRDARVSATLQRIQATEFDVLVEHILSHSS
jgi:hypothetical protein